MGLRIHQLSSLASSVKYVALAFDYERLFILFLFSQVFEKILSKSFHNSKRPFGSANLLIQYL